MAKIEGTITAGAGLKVRTAPEASAGAAAPSLPYQTKVIGEEVTNSIGEKWLKLISVNGVPVTYVGYSSMLYIRVDRVVIDTPPSEPILPLSFILTDPATGKKAEYTFVRIVE